MTESISGRSINLEGLRVCMLVYNTLTVDPRVWKEARTLAQHGAAVDIFALRRQGQPALQTLENEVVLHRFSEAHPASRRPRAFWRGNRALSRALGGQRYDIYHCHDGSTLFWGARRARQSGSKLIYDAHEYFADFLPAAVTAPTRQHRLTRHIPGMDLFGEQMRVRRADVVISVSATIARLLEERYSLAQPAVVVRNCVPYRARQVPTRTLHEKLSLPDPAKILLFLGAMDSARGFDNCIALLPHIPDAHLVALGAVPAHDAAAFRSQAERTGVADRVHLPGSVPAHEVPGLAESADVALYLADPAGLTSSYLYSLPNKIFEYIMARLPIVASGLPEISDLVTKFEVGSVVDPRDAESAASKVRQILGDPTLRAKLDANLDRAAVETAWEKEELQLLRAYFRVLSDR